MQTCHLSILGQGWINCNDPNIAKKQPPASFYIASGRSQPEQSCYRKNSFEFCQTSRIPESVLSIIPGHSAVFFHGWLKEP